MAPEQLDYGVRVFMRKEKARPQCSLFSGLLSSDLSSRRKAEARAVMKKVSSVIGILSLATLALAPVRAEWKLISFMRGEPASAPPKQRVAFVGSAVVKAVDGKAERLCGIDSWTPLSSGYQLKTGDIIQTGEGSVVLKMNESQSFVRVTPNTVLRLIPLNDRTTPDSKGISIAAVNR
jgi:hypothetical protein